MKRNIILVCLLWSVVSFRQLDKVQMQVNKVYSEYKEIESHSYYSLPFCQPTNIYEEVQSLGEAIEGDQRENSLYSIQYKREIDREVVCNKTLTKDEVKQFLRSIDENYLAEYIIDEKIVIDRVGVKVGNDLLLKTHLNLTIFYSKGEVLGAIVDKQFRAEDYTLLQEEDEEVQAVFTYSVHFHRGWPIDRGDIQQQQQVHWVGMFSSLLFIILLIGMVVKIFNNTLQKDLEGMRSPYGGTKREEVKWKYIRKEILMVPKARLCLSAFLGLGVQLGVLLIGLVILATFTNNTNHNIITTNNINNINNNNNNNNNKNGEYVQMNSSPHGNIVTQFLMLYCLTGCVNGYISNGYYQYLLGKQWLLNGIVSAGLLPSLVLIVTCPLHLLQIANHITLALSLKSILSLSSLLLFINLPLVLLGAFLGKINHKDRLPANQFLMPKQIPPKKWFRSSMFYSLCAGCVPFTTVSVEMYYILESIWEHKVYHLQGVLLVLWLLTSVVVGLVTIVLVYFTISDQDYKWWWKSFCFGASIGPYFFVYSLFFYFQSKMYGLFTFFTFAVYSFVLSLFISLFFGAVGFISTHRFIKLIYYQTRVI